MKTKFEKNLLPNQSGSINFVAEEPDDLWLLYNLIKPGDTITAETARKVSSSSSSTSSSSSKGGRGGGGGGGGGGGNSTTRVKFTVEFNVISSEYEQNSSNLRIKGRSLSSNSCITSGDFHTIELELNQSFILKKKIWDSESLNSLKRSWNNRLGEAELGVVLVEEGNGELFLVGKGGMQKLCACIGGGVFRRNSSNKFFESLLDAFRKYLDFSFIKCVVIAGPGSVKDQFYEYLFSEAQKLHLRSITENKSRVLCLATMSVSKQSLKEVSESLVVKNSIRDAKIGEEEKVFKVFSDSLDSNNDKVCYGLKNVEAAIELMAVEKILVNDDLLKSSDVEIRKKYESLVDLVKESGGTACVFSSAYSSGEELAKMTGVAAILRFPLPDLDYGDDL